MPRISFPENTSVHHVIVRCVAGAFLLGDDEKEVLRKQLEKTAAFCGVEVLAYVFMSNHYHLLVRVPELVARDALGSPVILERIGALYGARVRKELLAELDSENQGVAFAAKGRLERYRALMGDLSQFMKLYKMRFSRWYNSTHGRFGTLWAERFKSLVVEDSAEAVQALAAYIDLNPVRAGLCDDPKDYRFSSYAEAVAKEGMARDGLKSVFRVESGEAMAVNGFTMERWDKVQVRYRLLMYGTVSVTDEEQPSGQLHTPLQAGTVPTGRDAKGKSGVSVAKVRQVQAAGGRLGLIDVMKHKVRYFSQGVALGRTEFVERVFQGNRESFGKSRKDGARKMRGGLGRMFGELRTLRDLRG
jgi:putative transposase